MIAVLSIIIAFGILVIFHEFGHFWVAKKCGIDVETFSVGFGPKLFSGRYDGTEFCVSLIPLGGYVKMKGMGDEEEVDRTDPKAFFNKSLLARVAVVMAGPVMNFLLAFLIVPVVCWIGRPEVASLLEPPVIEQVLPDSPAAIAGLQGGETVLKVDGREIPTRQDLIVAINEKQGVAVELDVRGRTGETRRVSLKPVMLFAEERWAIGIQFPVNDNARVVYHRYGFVEGVVAGTVENLKNIALTFRVLKRLVFGETSYKTLGGPTAIAKGLATAAANGIAPFLLFTAFLSLQLGILNLLPIPMLDGGHLVFFGFEAVFRKPLSLKIRLWAQQIGITLLLLLVAVVTWNDLEREFGFQSWIKNFFQ